MSSHIIFKASIKAEIKCSSRGVWVVEGGAGGGGWRAMKAYSSLCWEWDSALMGTKPTVFKKCEGRKWGVAWPFSLSPSNKAGQGLVASSSKMTYWPYVIKIGNSFHALSLYNKALRMVTRIFTLGIGRRGVDFIICIWFECNPFGCTKKGLQVAMWPKKFASLCDRHHCALQMTTYFMSRVRHSAEGNTWPDALFNGTKRCSTIPDVPRYLQVWGASSWQLWRGHTPPPHEITPQSELSY